MEKAVVDRFSADETIARDYDAEIELAQRMIQKDERVRTDIEEKIAVARATLARLEKDGAPAKEQEARARVIDLLIKGHEEELQRLVPLEEAHRTMLESVMQNKKNFAN